MSAIFEPHKADNPIPGSLILAIFFAIVLPFFIGSMLFIAKMNSKPARKRSATVLVLGDVGRSPRMMYHAESLAKHGWETALVGYHETDPIPSLLEIPHVHLHYLSSPPRIVSSLPWIIRAPIRIAYQIVSVLHTIFFRVPVHTELLIVQNPPSIPSLALAQLVCLIAGSRLVIDWHNTGYSILSLRVGKRNPLVKVAKWFEATFGQSAYAHLFVTHALQEYLVKEWHLEGKSYVLHDRPPAYFRRTDPMSAHELFLRLTPSLQPPLPDLLLPKSDDGAYTALTHRGSNGMPELRPDRPALLVSSTSWTADEDFSLLITALDQYQAALTRGSPLPKLLVLITGKGALRSAFEKTVAARENSGAWKDVTARCTFVAAKDYPVLLGCADLGVSLHTSSSGRDLPMKVVDMFGCGVPVLAKSFPCIGELVKEGKNGIVFDNGAQLGDQLTDLLPDFPSSPKLDQLRSFFVSIEKTSPGGHSTPRSRTGAGDADDDDAWTTWDDNWDRVVYRGVLGRRP